MKRARDRNALRTEVVVTGNDSCTVRSSGLQTIGVPEVEIAGCPEKLKDVATNLVLQIAKNGLDTPGSVVDGKTIGGRFVRSDQPLIEAFRLVRTEPDSSILRIVDLNGSGEGFPRQLVATHLCSTAGAFSNDALRLLLVAVEVWPMDRMSSNAPLGDYEFNPNNFWTWIDLGTVLMRRKQIDDAILHWKTGICLWPRGGKLYASRMVARIEENRGGLSSDLAAREFWSSVTDESISKWCSEMGIELSGAAVSG